MYVGRLLKTQNDLFIEKILEYKIIIETDIIISKYDFI